MDVDRPVVIVNPRSAGGLSDRRWATMVGPLTEGLGPFDARFTESTGHARQLAHEESVAGRRLVVAFGGDGTISEVVDGLMAARSEAELGIIPRGTGGDFRRTLGLPEQIAKAAFKVRTTSPHPIDVGRVHFLGPDGGPTSRCFVNVASFGFSADVATRANESSKRLGPKLAFLGATVRSLIGYDNVEVMVSVDGGQARRRTVLLGAIGNGCYFGGGMKICPDGCLDDGLLDLAIVGDLGRLEVLTKISRIYNGTHLSLKEVESARIRTVTVTPVEGQKPIPLELDGETPGTLPATFEILPRALKLRF